MSPEVVYRQKVSDKDLGLLDQEIVQALKEGEEEQPNQTSSSCLLHRIHWLSSLAAH